jgi:hypothetical protein
VNSTSVLVLIVVVGGECVVRGGEEPGACPIRFQVGCEPGTYRQATVKSQSYGDSMMPSVISEVHESIYIGSLLSIRELQRLRNKQTNFLSCGFCHSLGTREEPRAGSALRTPSTLSRRCRQAR